MTHFTSYADGIATHPLFYEEADRFFAAISAHVPAPVTLPMPVITMTSDVTGETEAVWRVADE